MKLSPVFRTLLVLGALLLGSGSLRGQQMPAALDMNCWHISTMTLNPAYKDGTWATVGTSLESRSQYMIELQFLRAAGVLPDDPKPVIQKKIQTLWNRWQDQLTCRNIQFSVTDGNLIKFAVSAKFDYFLNLVIDWGVNLNRIDPADNRTVLDFVEDEMHRWKGKPLEKKLNEYREDLIDAGAKHRSELP